MKPAFATRRGLGGFLSVVLLCVALPAIYPAKWLPPKEASYAAMPDLNPMDYVAAQIYHEREPIDLLLIGSSRIWMDVHAPALQAFFEEKLKRPCVVRALGWQHSGFDEPYFVLRDVLAHRAVRMVAVYNEWDPNPKWRTEPHPYLYRSFRYSEDAAELSGLPTRKYLAVYGTSIFGMPRNLLSLVRPALPIDPESPHARLVENKFRAPDPRQNSGTLIARKLPGGQPMPAFRPAKVPMSEAVRVYGESTKAYFQFGDDISEYHRSFARKIGALTARHGTRLVMLRLPNQSEREGAKIIEPADWPRLLGLAVRIVGMTPDDFWGGLSEEDAAKLCSDVSHLNENGQALLTAALAPVLLDLYENP